MIQFGHGKFELYTYFFIINKVKDCYLKRNTYLQCINIFYIDIINCRNFSILFNIIKEVIFYLQQNLNMDNRDEYGCLWFVVDIAFIENSYKLLNICIEDPEYEMVQIKLQDNYLKKRISPNQNLPEEEPSNKVAEMNHFDTLPLPVEDIPEPSN